MNSSKSARVSNVAEIWRLFMPEIVTVKGTKVRKGCGPGIASTWDGFSGKMPTKFTLGHSVVDRIIPPTLR